MIAHQAHKGRFKIEALQIARPKHSGLCGADIESHVWIGYRFFDLTMCCGKAADKDYRMIRMMLVWHSVADAMATPTGLEAC